VQPYVWLGYGLSHTPSRCRVCTLSAGGASASGTLTVSADITNTEAVAGDEVVQLYTHTLATRRT
jgi:hypothetical protein